MSRLIRKSLEPILVGIEPIASSFIRNHLTVFYAHLYPDNDKPLDREKIASDLLYLKNEIILNKSDYSCCLISIYLKL